MHPDFTAVTELAGDKVSAEQIERLAHRYYWASEYCRGREVLEVACGAGQGLGYLGLLAKTLHAGDISSALVARARGHYGNRIEISEMDAERLPFPDQSLDIVILFEAIYYLPAAEKFATECRRVLRPGGKTLIATANKDLFDFNPSPFSQRYYGVVELEQLFGSKGFSCEFFGNAAIAATSWRQKVLRPIKALAVKLNLIPKTMAGKKLLKRLVFGQLLPMPGEITQDTAPYSFPTPLPPGRPDHRHKVVYLAATLRG